MHDVLRQRLLRKIESLPDEQIYQVLDFIEFLESKYADAGVAESTGLQRFAEGLEDKLRRKAVSPGTIREAFQLISAADRVLSSVSSAGRRILADLNAVAEQTSSSEGSDVPEREEEGDGPGSRSADEGPSAERAKGRGPGPPGPG